VRQAAYLQPFNPDARRALGRVLLDLGYADEAVVELQRARTLDPYDQQTVRLLEAAELRARQR
jgi:Flp pilus assembly protein TadD